MSNVANTISVAILHEFQKKFYDKNIPKNCCVCILNNGKLGVDGVGGHSPKVLPRKHLVWTNKDIRQVCTGNFIRG